MTTAVIGGGFYGCMVALHAQGSVVLLEREPGLLARASGTNQARVHGGYHYPRSVATAARSRANYTRFVDEFASCVTDSATLLYAIARGRSHTSASQFTRLCNVIGAPLRPALPQHAELFSDRLVEAVFQVEEAVFDATLLREELERRLHGCGVEVRLDASVEAVAPYGGRACVRVGGGGTLLVDRVVNCTYAGLGELAGPLPLRYELAEIALVEVPAELERVGVTVLDGPFFSLLPFPTHGLHSLTHVSYTPGDASAPSASRAGLMLRDAARYLPALTGARHRESLFEVKAIPADNERDDGRPILVKDHAPDLPMVSVLGSKLDNVYDVLPLVA